MIHEMSIIQKGTRTKEVPEKFKLASDSITLLALMWI